MPPLGDEGIVGAGFSSEGFNDLFASEPSRPPQEGFGEDDLFLPFPPSRQSLGGGGEGSSSLAPPPEQREEAFLPQDPFFGLPNFGEGSTGQEAGMDAPGTAQGYGSGEEFFFLPFSEDPQ